MKIQGPLGLPQDFSSHSRVRTSSNRTTLQGDLAFKTDLQYGKKLLRVYFSSHPLGVLFLTTCIKVHKKKANVRNHTRRSALAARKQKLGLLEWDIMV